MRRSGAFLGGPLMVLVALLGSTLLGTSSAWAGGSTDPVDDPANAPVVLARPTPAAAVLTPPFTLTPIDANAGYFLFQAQCPARSVILDYRWKNASNGNGWGQVAIQGGTQSVPLRMLAHDPGQTITVTIKCYLATGRVGAKFGPIDVVSGVSLLAAVPPDSGTGKRIVYSLSAQQLWAVEADETVAHTHLVSGRRLRIGNNRSQLGTFSVIRWWKSGACGGGCPYFVGFHMGVNGMMGFHQIPSTRSTGPYQSVSELGQPRSHGCVRQTRADAIWLFNWAPRGSVVVVVP